MNPKLINVGRRFYGGVFNGLFGNPVREKTVSEQYRTHIQAVLKANPSAALWLKNQIAAGARLYCPGCGVEQEGCHALVLKEEIERFQ